MWQENLLEKPMQTLVSLKCSTLEVVEVHQAMSRRSYHSLISKRFLKRRR